MRQPDPIPPTQAPAAAGLSVVEIRNLWPEVIDKLRSLRRATWTLVSQNVQVMGFEGNVLTLGLPTVGLRDQFVNGSHEPPVAEAVSDLIGLRPRIEAIVAPGGSAPTGQTTQPTPIRNSPQPPSSHEPAWADAPSSPPDWAGPADSGGAPEASGVEPAQQHPAEPAETWGRAPASEGVSPEGAGSAQSGAPEHAPGRAREHHRTPDEDASFDDAPLDEDQVSGADLLARELGASIIEEIPNS